MEVQTIVLKWDHIYEALCEKFPVDIRHLSRRIPMVVSGLLQHASKKCAVFTLGTHPALNNKFHLICSVLALWTYGISRMVLV